MLHPLQIGDCLVSSPRQLYVKISVLLPSLGKKHGPVGPVNEDGFNNLEALGLNCNEGDLG